MRPSTQAQAALLLALLALVQPARGEPTAPAERLAAIPFAAADPSQGQDINETCAGCHGEFGQGGKEGEYPRLAGLPAPFIAYQLLLFRDRLRQNLAMVEYVDHRQMPDPDIAHIAVHLAGIELPSALPKADETAPGFDALARLTESKRVVQIPQAQGDAGAGEPIYRRECRACHGGSGRGKPEQGVPMLAGQYTVYLSRQVDKYLRGERIHDPEDPDTDPLTGLSSTEIRDLLAYCSTLDDPRP
jgi:cytochrome c553